MATERRPYHRVADSVLHEPWSNDVFAFVGRLQAIMHERWRTDRLTPEQACTIVLGRADLMKVAGKLQPSSARALAERVASLVSCSVRVRGELVEITWPKYLDYQWPASEDGERSGHKRTPSASRVPRPASLSQEKTPKPPSPAAPGPAVGSRAPDRLSDEQRAKLRTWAEAKARPALHRLLELEEICLEWFRAQAGARGRKADWLLTVQTWIRTTLQREQRDRARMPNAVGPGSRPAPRDEVTPEDRKAFEEIPLRPFDYAADRAARQARRSAT